MRALSYLSFLFTSRLKEIVSREGALNSRSGTDAQADKDRQNGPKQCVPRFCENNIFSAFSETQGMFGPQLGSGYRCLNKGSRKGP